MATRNPTKGRRKAGSLSPRLADRPVRIIMNKSDLDSDGTFMALAREVIDDDLPVDSVSAETGAGLEPLLEQLAPGGRLVGPFGERDEQELLRITRRPDGEFAREKLGRCRFVDLLGEHGWAA